MGRGSEVRTRKIRHIASIVVLRMKLSCTFRLLVLGRWTAPRHLSEIGLRPRNSPRLNPLPSSHTPPSSVKRLFKVGIPEISYRTAKQEIFGRNGSSVTYARASSTSRDFWGTGSTSYSSISGQPVLNGTSGELGQVRYRSFSLRRCACWPCRCSWLHAPHPASWPSSLTAKRREHWDAEKLWPTGQQRGYSRAPHLHRPCSSWYAAGST